MNPTYTAATPGAYVHTERHLIPPAPNARYSPRVWFLVFVIEGLKALVLLVLGELCRISQLEERWREFNQPLRVDGCDLPHVLFGGLHQLMVYNPVGEG